MTGPEMLAMRAIETMVRLLGIKPEIANEAVANVNWRVNGALVNFDQRLVRLEEAVSRLERHFGTCPKPEDQPPMIEEQKEIEG